jgi:hypothetical protein
MSNLQGREYRSACVLYSEDGLRAVDILEFKGGETYLDERELNEDGAFLNRHSGRLVGPFASPDEAEAFVISTSWFCGGR